MAGADMKTMFGTGGTDSFLGLPAADLSALEADAVILGAPCATPYASVGPYCAGAPAAIRREINADVPSPQNMDFDLGGVILENGFRVSDAGNLAWDAEDSEANRNRIRTAVSAILDAGAVPVTIGGDDSIPTPVFQSFAGRGSFTILQIDAHIDWRDEVGGERWGLSSTMRRASEMEHVSAIVQAGQRAIGSARPADHADALDWGATFISAREIHAAGIARVLDAIPAGGNVLVSLDVDALDPSLVPAVIGPAPGGLTYWQVVEMIMGVAAKARIAGFNLVELMPDRDIQGIGALTAGRIVCVVLGLLARTAR